jgi:hypothetical protein
LVAAPPGQAKKKSPRTFLSFFARSWRPSKSVIPTKHRVILFFVQLPRKNGPDTTGLPQVNQAEKKPLGGSFSLLKAKKKSPERCFLSLPGRGVPVKGNSDSTSCMAISGISWVIEGLSRVLPYDSTIFVSAFTVGLFKPVPGHFLD